MAPAKAVSTASPSYWQPNFPTATSASTAYARAVSKHHSKCASYKNKPTPRGATSQKWQPDSATPKAWEKYCPSSYLTTPIIFAAASSRDRRPDHALRCRRPFTPGFSHPAIATSSNHPKPRIHRWSLSLSRRTLRRNHNRRHRPVPRTFCRTQPRPRTILHHIPRMPL